MSEALGVLAAILSSLLGGTTVAGTRYLVNELDALTIAALRHGVGALCFLPIAIYALRTNRSRRDLTAAALLGILFYGIFPWLFALALGYTTAARGSLAMASFPIQALGLAILLRVEAFSWTRLIGILISMSGLIYAILPAIARAGAGAGEAWKGDLIMLFAVFLGSIYAVVSRPYIGRVGALSFAAVGVCSGAVLLVLLALALGRLQALPLLPMASWGIIVYLGVFGTAVLFFLWVIGLEHASPALIAMTVPANPLVAMILGAWLLDERIGIEVIAGLVLVLIGIAVAMNVFGRRALISSGGQRSPEPTTTDRHDSR